MRTLTRVTLSGVLILAFIAILLCVKLVLRTPTIERNREFFGVGEPLLYRSVGRTGENINVTKAFEIMEFLGVGKLREWVWRYLVFDGNGTSLDCTVVERLKAIVREANSRNITVMGMVQDFPSWMTGIYGDQQCIPRRNLTEGSPYRTFLEKYETSWKMLAETFPEIELWEIGNEYNLPQFLHPEGYNKTESSTWFNYTETVDIVTDLLYYGSRGIKAGNPNATTVMCGLGPSENGINDMRDFLDSIYKNIKSGRWPSTNPDDFFEVACWHPYIDAQKPVEQNWINPNIEVHNVMVYHGDADKPVVFSEFGYSDNGTGLSEEQIAEYLNAAFVLAEKSLQPWLKTIYWFRLIDPDPNFNGNLDQIEYGFGLTKSPAKNYALKPAAHTYAIIEEYSPKLLHILIIILASSSAVLKKFLVRENIACR